MDKKTIAAQLYTVREFTQTEADFRESIKKVADIGYRAAQLSAIGEMEGKTVNAILREYDIYPVCTHTAWQKLTGDIERVIDYHRAIGCPVVGIGAMPDEYRTDESALRRFADIANGISESLGASGLRLSYHNHAFEFVRYGKKTALELLLELCPDMLFLADTYWIQVGGGDPADWIRRYRGRVELVHYKDLVIDETKEQAMAEVGEGNMNWRAINKACAESGTKWRLVEQDICRRDPFESLRISYENMCAMEG